MDFDAFALQTLEVAHEIARLLAHLAEHAEPEALMAALEIVRRDLGGLWEEC